MECEFCGEEIVQGSLACPRCGSPVSKPAHVEPEKGGASPAPEGGIVPEAPAAPPEEEYFSLAEETVTLTAGEEGDVAPGESGGTPGGVEQPPTEDVSLLADQNIMPGDPVTAEQIPLDEKLTGGYKGPEGPSVGGAGEQTADDPFGLKITETAPPRTGSEDEERGRFNWHNLKHVFVMIATVLIVGGIVMVALYFGFLRNKGRVELDAPSETVEDFFQYAVEGRTEKYPSVALTDAEIVETTGAVLYPYLKSGIVYLDKFAAETTSMDENNADVEIKELVIKVTWTDTGNTESKDLLEVTTKPSPIPNKVKLQKNSEGDWIIIG